jgi:hypothetical protein
MLALRLMRRSRETLFANGYLLVDFLLLCPDEFRQELVSLALEVCISPAP